MPSAPALSHSFAASTGLGYGVPRACRSVATWSTFTWRRTIDANLASQLDHVEITHELERSVVAGRADVALDVGRLDARVEVRQREPAHAGVSRGLAGRARREVARAVSRG